MATEALKAGFITNRDTVPQVKNRNNLNGPVYNAVGTVEMTTASDDGSTYRMVQIPSNARLCEMRLYSDDIGNTATINVGVYQTTENGGAVVDEDCFASAIDINTAALNGTDILYEAALSTAEIADAEDSLWEQLGLSSDPGIMYDIVITTAAAASTGGTLTLKVEYVL